jgi:hypothetical protein
MATDEDAEILRLMREAIQKSRGYASYWEWKLDKRQPELHAAQVLSHFLFRGQDCSVSNVTNDPPDVVVQLGSLRYGIEVTEIVDQDAVERAVRRKKQGLPVEYDWAAWNSAKLSEALLQIVGRKDKKLAANSERYDELLLAFVTDEDMIDPTLAAAVSANLHFVANYINRAFVVLSYDPRADKTMFPDGRPIFEIKISR